MTKLDITFTPDADNRFPVYCKYPQQFQAQPAYISLNIETGECAADYNGELGGVAINVWNNIKLTFPIRPDASNDEIVDIIESNKTDFQKILDDSAIEWDGNNNRGKLGDTAQSIYDQLNNYGNGFTCDRDGGMIDNLSEWINDDITLTDGQTIDELAQELFDCDGNDNYYFSDALNSAEKIKGAILTIWADQLYNGDDIPQNIAKSLLESGECDDSQWMDELKEFAQQ